MRIPSLTFALLLFVLSMRAQSDTALLRKIWIGPELAYLNISQNSYSMDFYGQRPQNGDYTLLGDTLRLHNTRYTGEKGSFYGDGDFLIKRLTSDSLILVPINELANKKLRGQPVLYYKDQALTVKKDLRFDSLFFKSTTCYGRCPAMEIRIDQKKQLKFKGGMFAIKEGDYTGVLADSTYQELLYLLSISELDHLKAWEQCVYDAPEYTLQVWYNNQMTFIENWYLPMVTNKIKDFLMKLPAEVVLTEVPPIRK